MQQTWLITGASSGLGAALVKAVLDAGHSVAAGFRKEAEAAAFSDTHRPNGLGLLLDVNREADVRAAVAAAQSRFGRIDVLVNNAGYGTIGAVEEFSMEEIRGQMETNYFGAVALTQAVLPLMRAQGSGHIFQISSAAGFKATPGFGIYNASKFALEGFSEALAGEVAPFGIGVTIVQPGPFRTDFAGRSIRLAARRMDEYKPTPVAQMYHYISRIGGRQEGDPEKAAGILIEYAGRKDAPLRLPLGNHALDTVRAKLKAVERDMEANAEIARSAVYLSGPA